MFRRFCSPSAEAIIDLKSWTSTFLPLQLHTYIAGPPHPQYQQTQHWGPSISDIMSRSDGTQRKLPIPQVPKVAVHDLLHSGLSSGESSTNASINGENTQERF